LAIPTWFRSGFYGGLGGAFLTALVLLWLWQPERQVRRHTENLFRSIEQKNWDRTADFIGGDYQDQWGHDRRQVIERLRDVFPYVRAARIDPSPASVRVDKRRAQWTARITFEADEGEIATLIKERVNLLTTPFELEWHRFSAKPWDWKLVHVSNSSLDIPADAY
jgi:hypothetical protein